MLTLNDVEQGTNLITPSVSHYSKVVSESPCRAELPTHIVYFLISSSVEIFQK